MTKKRFTLRYGGTDKDDKMVEDMRGDGWELVEHKTRTELSQSRATRYIFRRES